MTPCLLLNCGWIGVRLASCVLFDAGICVGRLGHASHGVFVYVLLGPCLGEALV